jgi:hypothetical protein
MAKRRTTGKFWPWVRELIWQEAESLHAADFHRSHTENITPPTRGELREGGYFYAAKLIVLRNIHRSGLR